MTLLTGGRQSVLAPAKLNLTLAVLGKRGDGYHEIASVVAKIALYDGLDLLAGTGPAIQLECSDSSLPTDARNLVWRACEEAAGLGGDAEPLNIRLFKRIPVGAGLGGGSSDAAAVLMALNRRWRLGMDLSALAECAARIGSDVASFIHPGAVFMTGRGETVEPVRLPWAGWVVLVIPPFGVSTAAVYQEARYGRRGGHSAEQARACLHPRYQTAELVDGVLFNDLEDGVFAVEPRLREIKKLVEDHAGRKVHLTGSGSTLFACSDSHEEAEQLCRGIEQRCSMRTQLTRVLTSDYNE